MNEIIKSLEIIDTFDYNELERQLREVKLNKPKGHENDPDVFVYRDVDISLQKTTWRHVNPPTFYLIKRNLQVQKELRNLFRVKGLDSLYLDGGVRYRVNDEEKTHVLIPPIIELTRRHVRYEPLDGQIDYSDKVWNVDIPVACDGSHRAWISREDPSGFKAIVIAGVKPEWSYYAHPNGWDNVQIMEDTPKTMTEKKMYCLDNPDYYKLYRDFSSLGSGGPRHTGRGMK